jgi:hypothetical protein
MTLASTTTRVQYNGNGSTTTFATTFMFLDLDHVTVTLTDASGNETTWTRGTQYTMDVTDEGVAAGGDITIVTSPTDYTPATGTTLTITRNVPLTQPDDLPVGGSLPSSTVESMVDKVVMMVQALSEKVGRGLALAVSSTVSGLTLPDPVAGQVMRWKTDLSGLENATLTAGSDVTLPIAVTDGGHGKTTAGEGLVNLGVTRKNAIINGQFYWWQRGTTFTNIASGKYSADRWKWANVGAGDVTITADTNVTLPNGQTVFALVIDVSVADASMAATDYYLLHQPIEGYEARRFLLGTAQCKTMTLSFWVKSTTTGTYCVAFRNSAADKGYRAEYTITDANTWEYKTVTVPAVTDGTWIYTSPTGLDVFFALAGGANQQDTNEAWTDTGRTMTSNQTNLMADTANDISFAEVQLEEGSEASAFEQVHSTLEFYKCARYFQKTGGVSVTPADGMGFEGSLLGGGLKTNNAEPAVYWRFITPMRATPTITLYNPRAAGTSGEWDTGAASSANARQVQVHNQGVNLDNAGNLLSQASQWYIQATADADL